MEYTPDGKKLIKIMFNDENVEDHGTKNKNESSKRTYVYAVIEDDKGEIVGTYSVEY